MVRLWQADWRMDVRISDVTQAMAAMNLAGPARPDILSQLTDIDCSNDALSYLDGRSAQVAGVPCLILRIGFVGELGYEIHVNAPHAEHLWSAIIEPAPSTASARSGWSPSACCASRSST